MLSSKSIATISILIAVSTFLQTHAVLAQKTTVDKKTKSSIAKSAKGELSAKQAEDLVRSRKEVKEWLALFAKAKKDHRKVGTPKIEAERDGANWMVHVYEQMPDHTATVNWYTVDPKTSKISTMF